MSKLIEKEGRFYKECGVVMLETIKSNNIGDIVKCPITDRMATLNVLTHQSTQPSTNQHLYIISNDEIKDGDWCLFFWDGGQLGSDKPQQYQPSEGHVLNKGLRKIIATTDQTLEMKRDIVGGFETGIAFPQPSDKFIQAYIEAYNKGEKIEKVLVEYEDNGFQKLCNPQEQKPNKHQYIWVENYQPKLKDNNIIIKKVKDSWTKEEVIILMKVFERDVIQLRTILLDEWIEENL